MYGSPYVRMSVCLSACMTDCMTGKVSTHMYLYSNVCQVAFKVTNKPQGACSHSWLTILPFFWNPQNNSIHGYPWTVVMLYRGDLWWKVWQTIQNSELSSCSTFNCQLCGLCRVHAPLPSTSFVPGRRSEQQLTFVQVSSAVFLHHSAVLLGLEFQGRLKAQMIQSHEVRMCGGMCGWRDEWMCGWTH